jgi:hypothetical protein
MRESYDDRTGPTPDAAPPSRRTYARRVECSESPETPSPRGAVRASRGDGVREPESQRDVSCGDAR